ncbi:MAG: FIST C-terminal domain-containing protein [Desulfovibrio sp.]|jgi:hypothetical protein|nr:FIST C-terminal domain-containing protein [Desulfovibrio sp.]
MLQFLTAFTHEVDDPVAAVSDILEQLDMENRLLAHSAGIVACYYEYIETGILEALADALPFDIIGCTALGSATDKAYGMEQLSITVLTSDTVRFAVSLSSGISPNDIAGPVREAWNDARRALPGDPGLVIALPPIMLDVGGAQILKQLDAACGGLPVFGTLSNDASMNYAQSRTFLNADAHSNKMALLLLYGSSISPRFYAASFAPRNIQQQKATVTASDGQFIRQVNGVPFIDYLASIGVQPDMLTALSILPFIVDYNDGTPPVAIGLYSLSREGALSGGEIPEGASITFTEIDYASILETAESVLRQALNDAETNGASAILAVSCMTRSLMLSPRSEDELQKSVELINGRFPFMLLYSGGEICPAYNASGVVVNRFHNYTFTLAVL